MTADDIFLVDDNPGNLRLLEGLLSAHGYKVRIANGGRLALKMIHKHPPELVLLDILMPDLDGYEVCRRLKDDPATSHIPIIFLSALDEPLDKVKAFGVGAVDYVTKPFHAEEVLARVETQLNLARLQRETEKKNAELRQAQEQIARLSEQPLAILHDTAGWAARIAREVAHTIGAREIGVWTLEDDRLVPLAAGGTAAPSRKRLRDALDEIESDSDDAPAVVPVLGLSGEPRGALVVDGPDVEWGIVQWRIVRSFAYHLGTALELGRFRDELATARKQSCETLDRLTIGVVLLGPKGEVLFANAAADSILRRKDGLFVAPDGLRAATRSDTVALRRLVASAADAQCNNSGEGAGGWLAIERPAPRRPYSVFVSPRSAARPPLSHSMGAAVAYVADPDRAIDIPDATLAELYQLTPAESAVVRELVLGRSVEEIAERLGITVLTARTHVKRILSKTGTRRQADVIRLILLSCCC